MNRRSNNFRFLILWAFTMMGMPACDTANNVENPDLQYFVKYYGGDGNQVGVDMVSLNDGSFLLLGNYLESNFDTDIYLVRVDAKGEVIWEKRIGDDIKDNIFNAKDLEPTNDGNFILLTDLQTDLGSEFMLYKISADGVILDNSEELNEPAYNYYGRTVTPLDDGGFMVSGTAELRNDPAADPGDTFSYYFDANLTVESGWSPVNQGFNKGVGQISLLDVAVKTVQATDTSYYVFGYTNSNINGNNQNGRYGLFYFARDSSGSLGSVCFPGNPTIQDQDKSTEIHFVQSVAPEIGVGFVALGSSLDPQGNSTIFIARLRSTLTFEQPFVNDIFFYERIPLNKNIRGVAATSSVVGESGFLVVGNEVRSTGALNIWISKIDQSRNILWSSTFGSEVQEDSAAAVVELPDGKIVVLGTMGLADNQSKMALIKLNPGGQLLK